MINPEKKSKHNVPCSNCGLDLSVEYFTSDNLINCQFCNVKIRAKVFRALYSSEKSVLSEEITKLGTSSCFFHNTKKAVHACDRCGRFICDLCIVEFSKEQICSTCLTTGKIKGKLKDLKNSQILYDQRALLFAFLSLILFIGAIILAPLSIFISIKNWNSYDKIVPRTKIRFVISILLSLTTLSLWTMMIANLFNRSG